MPDERRHGEKGTIVGPRRTCINTVPTATTTISTTGVKISGLAHRASGRKLAPNSAAKRTKSRAQVTSSCKNVRS